MRKVIRIIGSEGKTDTKDKPYFITHLLLDDGTEARYFGNDVEVGDEVEVFLHYGQIKARKGKPRST